MSRIHASLLANGMALGLAVAGGLACQLAGLPLAWLLGAMAACAGAALSGVPVEVAPRFRKLMTAILGVFLGAAFSPELIGRIEAYALAAAPLLLFVPVYYVLLYSWHRGVCGYDRATAFFASSPGGISSMTLMSMAHGGDARVVGLSHVIRVASVVAVLPLGLALMGVEIAAVERPASAAQWAGPGAMAALVAAGVVGVLLGRLVGLPSPELLGPLFVSGGLHVAGALEGAPPEIVIIAAQIVIGAALGCRFGGLSRESARRIAFSALGAAAIAIALGLAAAALGVALSGADWPTMAVAFAPGGVDQMAILAYAVGGDVAFVSTIHALRILAVLIIAPFVVRRGSID